MSSPGPSAGSISGRVDELFEQHPPADSSATEFLGALFDAGLSAVANPPGLGGLAAEPAHQQIVNGRLASAGAPIPDDLNPIGVGHIAPAIAQWGEPHHHELLRPLYGCEDLWCQLFSEPDAGSDLAGLSTRAVRDGDEWVINGQKVWTSLAHLADRSLLLARSDPSLPKHRGITAFLIDMRDPAVEVRPLRQMTGEAEFNEVHLNGLRLPDTARIGAPGSGWAVAVTTLTHERVANVGKLSERGEGTVAEVMRAFRRHRSDDPVYRDKVSDAWIRAELHRLTALRADQLRERGTPGPEAAVGKLSFSLLNAQLANLCVDLLGPTGLTYGDYGALLSQSRQRWDPDAVVGPAGALHNAPDVWASDEQILQAFLRSTANGIEAGSVEIMRNITAERVLGLPSEPRTDRDQPWEQLP